MMEASRFVDMVVWNVTPCHVAPVEEMSFSDCVKRCLRIFFVKDTSKEVLQNTFFEVSRERIARACYGLLALYKDRVEQTYNTCLKRCDF